MKSTSKHRTLKKVFLNVTAWTLFSFFISTMPSPSTSRTFALPAAFSSASVLYLLS